MTRSPLAVDKLAPNRALQDAINEFRQQHPVHVQRIKPVAGSVGVSVRAFERQGSVGTHDIVVSLDAGVGNGRSPVDLVCVIDISGSMDSEATVADATGKKVQHKND